MKQVVSAKTVLGGLPQRQFLKLCFQFRHIHLHGPQISGLSQHLVGVNFSSQAAQLRKPPVALNEVEHQNLKPNSPCPSAAATDLTVQPF